MARGGLLHSAAAPALYPPLLSAGPGETPTAGDAVITTMHPADFQARAALNPVFTLEAMYATAHKAVTLDEGNKCAYREKWEKFMLTETIAYDPTQEVELPAELLTKELLEAVEIIKETNGSKCYDAESIALGALKTSEYFLVPNTSIPPVCPARDVLRGRGVFKPDIVFMSQVYALARNQAKLLGFKEDDAHKWALMRNQAFAAGWYCGQRHTRLATPPKDSVKIFDDALSAHKGDLQIAYMLAGFVPFFHETTFRSQCSTWSNARAMEFDAKAKKLASSCGYEEELKFAETKLLFGTAYRWIGVDRVKDVLQADVGDGTVPRVFALRLESAPAGMTFICNCANVIEIMDANNWWGRIKEEGGYTDNNILALSKKIRKEPCKYHMMSGAYGMPKLTEAEETEVREARKECEKIASVLHAYTNVFMAGKPLANNKTIEKHALNGGSLYDSFRRLFSSSKGKRTNLLNDVSRKDVFGKPPAEVPRQRKKKPRIVEENLGRR